MQIVFIIFVPLCEKESGNAEEQPARDSITTRNEGSRSTVALTCFSNILCAMSKKTYKKNVRRTPLKYSAATPCC